MKMELIPAKLISDRNAAEEAVKSMGWDSLAHFQVETSCTAGELIGRWYMDMGDDCEIAEASVQESCRADTVMICGRPSRVYFGIGTLYKDAEGKSFLNLKEVG